METACLSTKAKPKHPITKQNQRSGSAVECTNLSFQSKSSIPPPEAACEHNMSSEQYSCMLNPMLLEALHVHDALLMECEPASCVAFAVATSGDKLPTHHLKPLLLPCPASQVTKPSPRS